MAGGRRVATAVPLYPVVAFCALFILSSLLVLLRSRCIYFHCFLFLLFSFVSFSPSSILRICHADGTDRCGQHVEDAFLFRAGLEAYLVRITMIRTSYFLAPTAEH